MFTKSPLDTHLVALRKVSAEIGVDGKTIVRNEADFFPVIKLGDKQWVLSKAYQAWLARIYGGIDNGRAA